MIIGAVKFENTDDQNFTRTTHWSHQAEFFCSYIRPLDYLTENFALYILKMADLGFIKTISEDDEVPVADESTDSDEEVLKFLKCLILLDSCNI